MSYQRKCKRLPFITVGGLALLQSLAVLGQTPTTRPDQQDAAFDLTPPAPDELQPKLEVVEPVVGAGEVWLGEKATARWEIRNGGEGLLRVRVHAACNAWPRQFRFEILPGGREIVEAEILKLARGNGEITQIWLDTNERDAKRVPLVAQIRTKYAVLFEVPGAKGISLQPYLSFGQIPRAGSQTKTIRLRIGDAGPLLPVVTSASAGLKAEVRELTRGEDYELNLTLEPEEVLRTGLYRGTVELETGVSERPTATIQVSAMSQPRLRAPLQIQLKFDWRRDPRTREPVERILVGQAKLVWSSERPPGKITSVSASEPELSVSVDTSTSGEITIVLSAPEKFQPHVGQNPYVTVKTDDPAVAELKLSVVLHGQRQPTSAPVPAPVQTK